MKNPPPPSACPQPSKLVPWGDEAFTKAKEEDKPVFLSAIVLAIGAT